MNGFGEWWDCATRGWGISKLEGHKRLAKIAWEAAKERAVKKAAEKRKEDSS